MIHTSCQILYLKSQPEATWQPVPESIEVKDVETLQQVRVKDGSSAGPNVTDLKNEDCK